MRQTSLPTGWASRLVSIIFILIASLTFATVGRAEATNVSVGNSAPKKAKASSYVIRYICFVAAPRQTGTFAAKEMPEVLRSLQTGSELALDPTPQAFLGKLGAADARLFYRLVFSGETAFEPGAAALIRWPLDPNNPSAVAVEEQVQVMPDETGDGTLALRRTGALMRRTAQDQGKETVRWKGALKRSVVPGRTYSHVMAKLPTGERLIYAYAVVEAAH